jgi:hypothetical protein
MGKGRKAVELDFKIKKNERGLRKYVGPVAPQPSNKHESWHAIA